MVAVFEAAWSSPRRIPIYRHRLAPGPTPPRSAVNPVAVPDPRWHAINWIVVAVLRSCAFGPGGMAPPRYVTCAAAPGVKCAAAFGAKRVAARQLIACLLAGLPCHVAESPSSSQAIYQGRRLKRSQRAIVNHICPPARRLHLCTYENTQVAKLTTSDIKIDGPVARAFEPVSGSLSHAATKGGKRRVTWETLRR